MNGLEKAMLFQRASHEFYSFVSSKTKFKHTSVYVDLDSAWFFDTREQKLYIYEYEEPDVVIDIDRNVKKQGTSSGQVTMFLSTTKELVVVRAKNKQKTFVKTYADEDEQEE